MADTPPIPVPRVGQVLVFVDGTLYVYQSFSSNNGLLHMTVDGGFYYRPGVPLTENNIAAKLPNPYKQQALQFIQDNKPKE